MKKSLLLLPVLAAIAACGNGGEKGPTIARIDGSAFTEGDLDLRLSTQDDLKRQQTLSDPDQRRAAFQTLLHDRLFALAGQNSRLGSEGPLIRRLALMDERVQTQYYFDTYLAANGGHTRKEIEDYYAANPAKFSGDSGRTLPLAQIYGRVVDSLVLSKADLSEIYKTNGANYKRSASCAVSVIQTDTRAQADAALKALKAGTSFGDVAVKFSTGASKTKGGAIGRVVAGGFAYEIGSQSVSDSLLFNPATRLKAGQYSGILSKPPGFVILKGDSCQEEAIPPLNEIRPLIGADYVRDYREKLSQGAVENLKKKYGLRLVSPYKEPTEKEIQAYYEDNKDAYESPETYELYDVEFTDAAKLKTALKGVKDLGDFKALASKSTENPLAKPQQGYLGVVKRDFSLPYGVGMMPSLFAVLDQTQPGKISDVVQHPTTQKWHAFWVVQKGPRQLKPLARVHGLVREDLKANRLAEVSPADTLAVLNNGQIVREDDVLFLKQEIPPNMQERYTRETLVDYLVTWQLASDEVAALGMNKERQLRAALLQNEDSYWGHLYQDSILSRSWEEDPNLLMKTFKARRALFTQDTVNPWNAFTRDIAASLYLTPRDFEIEYRSSPERYRRDTAAMPFADAQPLIFQNLKPLAFARQEVKLMEKLKARFKVSIVDPSLNEPSLEPTSATYKKAQDLHYARQLEPALALYGKLREAFPDRAGLQDSVCLGMAQVYLEQERYPQAMAEYRRLDYLYPKSPNDYKALFMIGFIYSEHLKEDSSAVRAFRTMLDKYPKTDLSDDADWMIRNIRSGGKLMPVLQDDSTDAARKPEETPAKSK